VTYRQAKRPKFGAAGGFYSARGYPVHIVLGRCPPRRPESDGQAPLGIPQSCAVGNCLPRRRRSPTCVRCKRLVHSPMFVGTGQTITSLAAAGHRWSRWHGTDCHEAQRIRFPCADLARAAGGVLRLSRWAVRTIVFNFALRFLHLFACCCRRERL